MPIPRAAPTVERVAEPMPPIRIALLGSGIFARDAHLPAIQALGNLVSNAIKYSDRGGPIRLIVGREGDEAIVRVQDAGVGIPPEMLADVFEMFTQVDRSLERSQGGLGVGLAIVKRLVELHGGNVEAKSEGAGRGSEFVIRLPVVPPETLEKSAS